MCRRPTADSSPRRDHASGIAVATIAASTAPDSRSPGVAGSQRPAVAACPVLGPAGISGGFDLGAPGEVGGRSDRRPACADLCDKIVHAATVRSRDPEVDLPLPALGLLVLLVLLEGSSYGYGVVKAVSKRTNGSIDLAPGNVYQTLDRLLSRDWSPEFDADEEQDGGDRRQRYYAGTPDGARATAVAFFLLLACINVAKRLAAQLVRRRRHESGSRPRCRCRIKMWDGAACRVR